MYHHRWRCCFFLTPSGGLPAHHWFAPTRKQSVFICRQTRPLCSQLIGNNRKNASTQRVQLGNEEKGSDIRTCAAAPVLRPNAVTVYGAKKIFQIQRSSLASRPCQLRAQRPKRLLEYERARWVSSAEQKIIFCPTSQHILSSLLHLPRRKKRSLWFSPLRQEDQQSDINLDRPTLLQ